MSILMLGSTSWTPATIAGLEGLDERTVDTADEADVLGLGLQCGGRTDEERALVGGEGQVGGVLSRCVTVDHREAEVRVVRGDRVDGRRVDEAHRDDRVEAALGEQSQTLFAVRVVLSGVGLCLFAGGVEVVDQLGDAGVGRVVERLVTATAHVIRETDLGAVAVGGLTDILARCAVVSPPSLALLSPSLSSLAHPANVSVAAASTAAILVERRKTAPSNGHAEGQARIVCACYCLPGRHEDTQTATKPVWISLCDLSRVSGSARDPKTGVPPQKWRPRLCQMFPGGGRHRRQHPCGGPQAGPKRPEPGRESRRSPRRRGSGRWS